MAISMAEKPKQLRIDHNTTVTVVTKIDDSTINVKFRYTVSYGHVGNIRLEGGLNYTGKADDVVALWTKEHRMTNDVAEEIHNVILNNGSFEALMVARKLNLPPPIKMEIPRVKFEKKQKKVSPDYSPEVA